MSGGIDSSAPYPGLIRIKRLFPHQAAWMTGQLQQGMFSNKKKVENYELFEIKKLFPCTQQVIFS